MNSLFRKKCILIRADASQTAGLGHLIRSLALAEILSSHYKIHFVCEDGLSQLLIDDIKQVVDVLTLLPSGMAGDIPEGVFEDSALAAVVLDGYLFTHESLAQIRKRGVPLAWIVDSEIAPKEADMLLSHSLWINDSRESTQLYYGAEYVMVRRSFRLNQRTSRAPWPIQSIFICCGGLDSKGYALKILSMAKKCCSEAKFHLILGTSQKDLTLNQKIDWNVTTYRNLPAATISELLQSSQVAITSASGVALEAASVGIGLAIGFYTENQQGLYRQLTARGCAVGLGSFDCLNQKKFDEKWSDAFSHQANIMSILKKQRIVFDGKSAERIIKAFSELVDA